MLRAICTVLVMSEENVSQHLCHDAATSDICWGKAATHGVTEVVENPPEHGWLPSRFPAVVWDVVRLGEGSILHPVYSSRGACCLNGMEKHEATPPALPPQWPCHQKSKLHLRKIKLQVELAESRHRAPNNTSASVRELRHTGSRRQCSSLNLWTVFEACCKTLPVVNRNYTEDFATLGLRGLSKGLRNHNRYFRANSLTCSKWLAFALRWQSTEVKPATRFPGPCLMRSGRLTTCCHMRHSCHSQRTVYP